MDEWSKLAGIAEVESTAAALRDNGMEVFIAEDAAEAKRKSLEIIPDGAEVFALTSKTLDQIGLSEELNTSGRYVSVRNKLNAMDRATQASEMRKLGASPEWAAGSAHAVTYDGKIIVASATGSQLPSYAYGAGHVLFVIGTQKLVKDVDAGFKRIYEYVLPLESERARVAYGVQGSSVNKILMIQREYPGRITVILVRERLGF